MVGTFNQVILKDLTFDHVMFVFAAKIHRQSTSDNERGGKSWAGMILISCTFPKLCWPSRLHMLLYLWQAGHQKDGLSLDVSFLCFGDSIPLFS